MGHLAARGFKSELTIGAFHAPRADGVDGGRVRSKRQHIALRVPNSRVLGDASGWPRASPFVAAIFKHQEFFSGSDPCAQHVIRGDVWGGGKPAEVSHAFAMQFGDAIVLLQRDTVPSARLDAVWLQVKEHVVGAAPCAHFNRTLEAIRRDPDSVRAVCIQAHEFHAVAPPTVDTLRPRWVEIQRNVRDLLGILRKRRGWRAHCQRQ